MDTPGESDQEVGSYRSESGGGTSSLPSPPSLPNPPRDNDLAFPMRLHEMIKWVESNYPHSSRPVNWLSSGRAFTIRDRDELATTILPRFFNQSKIESFARKLNRWGFNIIRSGPEKGAYMHKDFVRWEEPFAITSMSKDSRRKRKSPSRKANSTAVEDSPPQNKPTSTIVEDEDDQKMPARNDDNAMNDLFCRKRTLETMDPSGTYPQQTSHDSWVRLNQAFENYKEMQPRSHENSNPNNAAPSGGTIRRSTNEHTSWNEGLFSWNQTESFLDFDNLKIQGDEQSFHLNVSIGLNRSSAFPQYMENQDSSWLHTHNSAAQQPINFPPAQPAQFNTMISEHVSWGTASTNTNAMSTSFNDAITATNSMAMSTAMLTNNSTMHGIEARNDSDFANNNMNIYHNLNSASTYDYQAFEIQQPKNFPPAQPGLINTMLSGNANTHTVSLTNNMMMTRSHDGMMAINNDIMISYNAQRNAAMHGFGTTDVGDINFPGSSDSMNVDGKSDVCKEDIFSPLAIFSPSFDRDVAEGRITFTTAAAARNEDCQEDTKGTSTTRATEHLDEDEIDCELRDYFQQLEKSIWSEEKKQRRL